MHILRWFMLAIAGTVTAAHGAAPAATAMAAATERPAPSPPYFSGDAAALFVVLPPAPQDGDAPRWSPTAASSARPRALAGSPRWLMAAADAELGSSQMLQHFSCALDIELTPQRRRAWWPCWRKPRARAAASMARAKDFYQRHRPFTVDEGPTCVATSTVGQSFDYPSGHTTAGWAWGLVLAQVDTQHATPLLARGPRHRRQPRGVRHAQCFGGRGGAHAHRCGHLGDIRVPALPGGPGRCARGTCVIAGPTRTCSRKRPAAPPKPGSSNPTGNGPRAAPGPLIKYAAGHNQQNTAGQMAERDTVLVDDLVDRQQLTGRNYSILGLLLVALLCDGFDLQIVAVALPRIARDWGHCPAGAGLGAASQPHRHDVRRDGARQPGRPLRGASA